MKKILLIAGAAFAATTAFAQLTPGTYYVRNTGTGLYLSAGWWWENHAVVRAQAKPFELIADGDNFKLKSTFGYLTADAYLTGGEDKAASLQIVKAEGSDRYTIKCGDRVMNAWEGKTAQNNGSLGATDMSIVRLQAETHSNSEWEFVTKETMIANLANATGDSPRDASFLLQDALQSNGDETNIKAAWNVNCGEFNTGIGGSQNDNNETYSKIGYWRADPGGIVPTEDGLGIIYQEADGCPEGLYTCYYYAIDQVEVQAPAAQVDEAEDSGDDTESGDEAEEDTDNGLKLTINDTKAEVGKVNMTHLWGQNAFDALKNGGERSVNFTVGSDGKMKIQFEKPIVAGNQNRFAFKNFVLKYKGKDTVTGVAAIEADENAPVEYYNLQGVRVANPGTGIFIKRQGSKVTKIIK